jgi:hypothetical protein
MKVYVITFKVLGKYVRKVLVLDERIRGIKKLPSTKELSKEEFKEKVLEVCREINELRYKGYSWSRIADIYGVKKESIRSFYQRNCKSLPTIPN